MILEHPEVERVSRVARQLHDALPKGTVHIVLLREPAPRAFVSECGSICLSDDLVRRCPTDAALAFILAHELAHVVLRHGVVIVPAVRRHTEREADFYGLNLAIASGFEPDECLGAFDVMRRMCLEAGDVLGAYGPRSDGLVNQFNDWFELSWRSHPVVPARIADATSHIAVLRFLVEARRTLAGSGLSRAC